MEYYLLICSGSKALEIIEYRLNKRIWPFGVKTGNKRRIDIGDKLLFYIGSKDLNKRVFIATAVADSRVQPMLIDEPREWLRHPKYPKEGLLLRDAEYLKKPVNIVSVRSQLSFIGDKENMGFYLRGGAKKISEKDWQFILTESSNK